MSRIKSILYWSEKLLNTERKFGANKEYFPAYIEITEGKQVALLFTERELEVARIRAEKNTEDLPAQPQSFFNWLFGVNNKSVGND